MMIQVELVEIVFGFDFSFAWLEPMCYAQTDCVNYHHHYCDFVFVFKLCIVFQLVIIFIFYSSLLSFSLWSDFFQLGNNILYIQHTIYNLHSLHNLQSLHNPHMVSYDRSPFNSQWSWALNTLKTVVKKVELVQLVNYLKEFVAQDNK